MRRWLNIIRNGVSQPHLHRQPARPAGGRNSPFRGLLAESTRFTPTAVVCICAKSGEPSILMLRVSGVPSRDEFVMLTAIPAKPVAVQWATRWWMPTARSFFQVVMLTEQLLPYPHNPASLRIRLIRSCKSKKSVMQTKSMLARPAHDHQSA